jgi:hypothetical protein
MKIALACSAPSDYSHTVAAKSAHGFGDPEAEGGHRLRAVFLCPQHGKPVMGGPCGSPSGLPVSSGRFANLHGSALPFGDGERITIQTEEAFAMTPRHTLARNPSTPRTRANLHRRRALAALKLDSSLSVRLSRYWREIERARALESMEVAQ